MYNEKLRKLKAGVHILDSQYKIIIIQDDIENSGKYALLYYLGLFLGILSMIMTLAWILQM
jgi:hypothetical protein